MDADDAHIFAVVLVPCLALIATVAGNMGFCRHPVSYLKTGHTRPQGNNITGKFVTKHHGNRDPLLCPCIPDPCRRLPQYGL